MAAKTKNETISLNTRVEMIRRFFTDSKPANHPITEHPVSKQEEYVRDLYLEMLCVMAQYENQNPENAFVLIKRILAACENPQPLNEYIKRSMEITTERTAEFIRQCKSSQLCEIFMIDSMLLSCSQGTPNEKQVAFLTQFGEMLGLNNNSLLEISKFSVTILEQDSDGYQSCISEKNLSLQEAALCYAKQFVNGKIIETSTRVVFYALQITDTPCLKEDISIENKEQVEFENLTFINTTIALTSIKNISFHNCSFKNYKDKAIISASKVDEINITECTFYSSIRTDNDCRFGLICLDGITVATFSCSVFSNCSILGDANGYNVSLIYANDMPKGIIIDGCEFNKIVVNDTNKYYNDGRRARAIIFANSVQSVTNCIFFDCNSSALFSSVSKQENNKISNCSYFTSKCY